MTIHFIGDGGHARAIYGFFRLRWRDDEAWFVAIGDNAERKKEAQACAGPFATIIAEDSKRASDVKIGTGTVVMPGAIIMAGAGSSLDSQPNSGYISPPYLAPSE